MNFKIPLRPATYRMAIIIMGFSVERKSKIMNHHELIIYFGYKSAKSDESYKTNQKKHS